MAMNILDAVLFSNPYTGLPYLIYKGAQGVQGARQEPRKPAAPRPTPRQQPASAGDTMPPPPPEPGWFEGDQGGSIQLPPPINPPPGNSQVGSLGGILERIIQKQEKEAKEAREFYPERSKIDYEYWKKREQIALQNALARMEEKTYRDTELQTIQAWQGITQAQIQKDTALALGMLNLSATMGMPNANVLASLAGPTQQAISAFQPGKPVF